MWNLFTFYLFERYKKKISDGIVVNAMQNSRVRKKYKNVSPNKRLLNNYQINTDLFLICNLQIQSTMTDIKL